MEKSKAEERNRVCQEHTLTRSGQRDAGPKARMSEFHLRNLVEDLEAERTVKKDSAPQKEQG